MSRRALGVVAVATTLVIPLLLDPPASRGADLGAANEEIGQRKTLERFHDPVVVRGKDLGALPTRDSRWLRLFRLQGSRLEAIRYQFDPRDRAGDLAVGAPADITFDDNDELAFMAQDTGDRAPEGGLATLPEHTLEIEITDPQTTARGWAYLAAFDHSEAPPARCDLPPYVTIDDSGRVARSESYQVEYAPQRNYFTGLQVTPSFGGRNVNLLRQSKMRGSPTFSLLLTDVTLDFTEQNSIVEIDGVRSGPVRAIRRARLSVDLGSLFPELPSGIAYTVHYATSYLTPSKVSFPWVMVKALRDFRFESTLDFTAEGQPASYFDAETPSGVNLTTSSSEVRTTGDHEWWVHSSDAGTMLHAFVIPERWRHWGIERGTIVRPAKAASAEEEDCAVSSTAPSENATAPESPKRAAGYTLLHMTKLREAGTFDLMMASVVLPRRFRPGDERAPMAMLRDPLRTSVRPLRRSPEL